MVCYDAIPFFDRSLGSAGITLESAPGPTGGATSFAVDVVQSADVATRIIQVDLHFDREILELRELVPGDVYDDALSVSGVAGQTEADAIKEANRTGTLRNVSLVHDAGMVPPGEHTAFRATFFARRRGVSPVVVSGQEMLDADFQEMEVVAQESSLSASVLAAAATPTPTVTITVTAMVSAARLTPTSPAAGQDAAGGIGDPSGMSEGSGLLDEPWKRVVLLIVAANVVTGLFVLARGIVMRNQDEEWG